MEDTQAPTCKNHPDRETYLRCNQCDQPICPACAIQTPTGYRCKSCVKGQQKKFETTRTSDFVLAPLIAASISLVASFLVGFIGFFIFFAAPLVGVGIVSVVRAIIKNRRGGLLFNLVTIGSILGCLPAWLTTILPFLFSLQSGSINIYSLLPAIYQSAFVILVASSVYYRLKGIRL